MQAWRVCYFFGGKFGLSCTIVSDAVHSVDATKSRSANLTNSRYKWWSCCIASEILQYQFKHHWPQALSKETWTLGTLHNPGRCNKYAMFFSGRCIVMQTDDVACAYTSWHYDTVRVCTNDVLNDWINTRQGASCFSVRLFSCPKCVHTCTLKLIAHQYSSDWRFSFFCRAKSQPRHWRRESQRTVNMISRTESTWLFSLLYREDPTIIKLLP